MNKDLTKGKIYSTILRLAIPIAGGQIMQMTYNLLDMFWLGLLSGDALAAAGISGLFFWLSVGLMLIGRVGAEVGVSQSRGRGDMAAAYKYSRTAVYIAAVLGTVYGTLLALLRTPLIGLFSFADAGIAANAAAYTGIMALGIPAVFVFSSISGTFVASGNAKTPLFIGGGALALNMVLTPLFVFTFGLGVAGAAVASVISQYIGLGVGIFAVKRFKSRPFAEYKFFDFKKPELLENASESVSAHTNEFDNKPVVDSQNFIRRAKQRFAAIIYDIRYGTAHDIFKITIPICLENTAFPLLTMITTGMEISFGDYIASISRVAIQMESLTWLVGAGFGAALTAFVGQNFGAGNHDRIATGVRYTTYSLITWGICVSMFLWFGGDLVFRIFLHDYADYPQKHALFITYMRMLATIQIFANIEFVAANAFRGKGRTIPPSTVGIVSNVIRVPLAFVLMRTPLGIIGVWLAICITAALRGIGSGIWYWLDSRRERELLNRNDGEV